MRKIKNVTVALMLFATLGAFATEGKKDVPVKNLSSQIYDLLKENQFNVETNELTADVRFIINEKGEVVVLSVETNNEVLESFVKTRLNYQKVKNTAVVPGRVYEIPVRITA